MSNALVDLSRDGNVAIITVNNPPVNALSPGVPEGVAAHVATAVADPEVAAIVVIGGGRTFIAGADIREFGKITAGLKPKLDLHPMLNTMEDSPKPIVMAIHGTALGGGLEVAMAGHYRVAVAGAQVGQPEVKLGIIPGAAGTQRLPRLCGVAKAAEMCALGDLIPAPAAAQLGIIDQIIEGDLLAGAVAFAREAAARPIVKVRDRAVAAADVSALRASVAKRMRGQPAAIAAIDAVEAAARLPFAEGIVYEAELFQKCLHSNESKALIHVFFGERTVAKIPGIGKDVAPQVIARAAVIGAGTMGGGIAMNYANAGIPVLLKESTQEALDKGLAAITRNYAGTVKKGRLSQADMDKRLALITPTLSYDGFADADIIVEAVFENMALKQSVFGDIDAIAKPGAILASNTSTLDIDAIAAATKGPEQVIGHHFFSPANVMRLLEIVRGKATSNQVIATSMELAKRLKKVGVLAGNCRGFIGNRMFHQYVREACFLVEEGGTPQEIDGVLYEWGMAMGPLAVIDLAGLDVGYRIRQEFKHTEIAGVRYPFAADVLVEVGRHGHKTRAGFYRYDENRVASPDAAAEAMIRDAARAAGVPQRALQRDEILERCLYALINEGAALLEEGIAIRSVDIDIVYINGYGFPAWRGGPMKYADLVGVRKVYERIEHWHHLRGYHWKPAPLLEKLAREGKTFADYDRAQGGGE
ncbi:MAG: 3-hydroxyacyl-CoA dehydrogenase [Acidobacteria bacterium]|nr:3-hydroxyacyl-CoA dehydrogenase [Acidobacteriota bacterium]